MPRRARTLDLRSRTAHHEAGHAVLSAALNDRPERVSIRGREGTLGRSTQRMFARPTSLAQVYLAGFAAEHLLTGRRPRGFDIEVGLGILAHLDRDLVEKIEGVYGTDGYGAVHQVLRTGVREVEDEIRGEVGRLYDVACQSLRAVWPSVRAVARALLVHEELDRGRLDAAIGDVDLFAPAFAVQRAHGLVPTLHALAAAEGPLVEAAATKRPSRAAKGGRPPGGRRPEGRGPGGPRPANTRPAADGAPGPRIAALLSALRRDPELMPVVHAYEEDAATPGRKFGKNGLKTKAGKLFALFTQGTLVVKLPNDRVDALVTQGVGDRFDPGHGRLMKGWLTLTSAKASWANLAREAFAFVGGEARA